MKRSALSILREDKAAAARFAEQVSKERARKALERAQRELNERLQQAVAPGGAGADSFTAAQLRSTLEQVHAVLGPLTQSLKSNMLDIGKTAAATAAVNTASYVQAAEDEFGLGRPLPLDSAALIDAAVAGTNASLVRRIAADPNHPGQPGVIARYGLATMGKFEEALQQRLIQGKPWEAVKADLVTDSPFLQQAPAHWAERLLRTETMFASNKASFETFKQVESVVGEMLKILVATFDDRTGSDSYAVHGQIRRTSEAFESWFGPYMHPPNRPNDREVVVPHNMSWPLPPELKALSDGAVASRWAAEGRKGSPPPRPLMSTVDLEMIGKVTPPPVVDPPPAPALPPTPPPEPQAPPQPPPPVVYSIPTPQVPSLFESPINVLANKVAEASGSNPGGVYEGSDGVQRYVKFYADKAQAAGEHLANKIYEKLGLGALESELFNHQGKVVYASKILPKAEQLGAKLDAKSAKKALDGFAADVLLGNWDAAGLNLDNMLVVPGGRVLRVDNGAALLTRAQGTRKPQSAIDNPSEWSSFFDEGINPAYAKIARVAGVTKPEDMAAQVVKGIEKIDKLARRKGGWGAFVDEHAPDLSSADRDQIVEMLATRTAFLRTKLPALKAIATGQPVLPPPVPIDDIEIVKARQIYPDKASTVAEVLTKQPEKLAVVEHYTAAGYVPMNKMLINPKVPPVDAYGFKSVQETQQQIHTLQQTLKEAKEAGHAVDGVVYRGVRSWPGLMQEINSGEIGFKCFSSCTTSPHVAEQFAGGSMSDKSLIFRIRQRSAIPLERVTQNGGEYEALLPAGIRFRVISKRPGDASMGDGARMIVDLEEID